MKGKKIIALVSSVVILSSFSLYGCTFMPKDDNAAQPVLIKPQSQEFTTDKVKRGTAAHTISGSGTLESFVNTDLFFTSQNQRIKSIRVKAGETVKKGQVLIVGESDELNDNIKDVSYEIQKAEISYNRKCQKLSTLRSSGKDSEAIKDAQAEIEVDKLSLEQSRNKLEKLQKDAANLNVVAPYDGVISFMPEIKEGESAEGFKTLAIISDPSKMQVEYKGTEAEITTLQLGQKVEITCGDKKYNGKIAITKDTVSKEDADKYKEKVIISFDNAPHNLKIGESVPIDIIIAKKDNTLIVPKAAVTSYSGSDTVSVMEKGKKRDVPVKVGVKGDTVYEILSGLEEGQEVIID